MRIRLLAPVLGLFFAGCGIVTKDIDGNVLFDFTIDDEDNHYENIITFDPNSNQDVKENRDKIEAGTVLEISLELVEVLPGNLAQQVAGQVDVRPQGAADDAWIMAVGQWSGIPLYDDTGSPALGQKFKLDLPIDTQSQLSDLVFEQESALDFRLNGYGYNEFLQPKGPVKIRGQVDVHLNVQISAP